MQCLCSAVQAGVAEDLAVLKTQDPTLLPGLDEGSSVAEFYDQGVLDSIRLPPPRIPITFGILHRSRVTVYGIVQYVLHLLNTRIRYFPRRI